VVSVLIPIPSTKNQDGELSSEQARVIDLLASRGMVPPLRYAQNGEISDNSQESQALSG